MNNLNAQKRIIIKPLISEKSINNVDSLNKYTFIVLADSNKIEVGQEIEKTYGVTVVSIRTINYTGKIVSFGKKRIPGRRDNFKKAIVTLKKGDKISVFDIK